MASSINDRLNNLKVRRSGASLHANQVDEALARAFPTTEAFERRSNQVSSQYALGAMQEVDPTYTANSYAEGERVRSQLQNSLPGTFAAEFDYQGSVPLNVHIKGVSDIDLLILRTDFVTVDRSGPRAGVYRDLPGETPAEALGALRNKIASDLKIAFPQVNVDVSGAKCITLSGGSLRRNIDVIPSHWHDTAVWQASKRKPDRGIKILNSADGSTLLNMPFLHIEKIHNKDLVCSGGAKKVIRLLKNLSADSDLPDAKKLSSYDIASVVWHFPNDQLAAPIWNELALLATTQEALAWIVANPVAASGLRTPDDSRVIFDSPEKVRCVGLLLDEVNALVDSVAGELAPLSYRTEEIIKTLRESYIGAV